MKLPAELLEPVIHFSCVRQDETLDVARLAQLCLVARPFLEPCRKLLYKDLTLDVGVKLIPVEDLTGLSADLALQVPCVAPHAHLSLLLGAESTLSRYVRTVRIVLSRGESRLNDVREEAGDPLQHVLFEVLDCFESVRRIELVCGDDEDEPEEDQSENDQIKFGDLLSDIASEIVKSKTFCKIQELSLDGRFADESVLACPAALHELFPACSTSLRRLSFETIGQFPLASSDEEDTFATFVWHMMHALKGDALNAVKSEGLQKAVDDRLALFSKALYEHVHQNATSKRPNGSLDQLADLCERAGIEEVMLACFDYELPGADKVDMIAPLINTIRDTSLKVWCTSIEAGQLERDEWWQLKADAGFVDRLIGLKVMDQITEFSFCGAYVQKKQVSQLFERLSGCKMEYVFLVPDPAVGKKARGNLIERFASKGIELEFGPGRPW